MENKWEASQSLFACPLCGMPMKISKSCILCKEGHCYDISKKGYINFAGKSNVKIYNKELFENRRLVYDSGFYDEVIETINVSLAAHGCCHAKCFIVDAGCGEGTFLTKLCGKTGGSGIGFDISRDAVLQACKRSKEILWLVADLANIPLKDHCADTLLNIFTPANYQSFNRILKNDGIMIKVIPGRDYLKEFREAAGTRIRKQTKCYCR